MKKQHIFSLFVIVLSSVFSGLPVLAQSDCDKALIDAENLYQSGQLYDISDKLVKCLESGFNYQQKQTAYRLLALTYLNINQEEQAKSTLLKLLQLNPDYRITKEKDPVELFGLYQQFNVDPVYYIGLRGGVNMSYPYILNQRSSSVLSVKADKFYEPSYGFQLAGDFAIPLFKNLLLEASPGYSQTSYLFRSLYLTDAFSETAEVPQVQEVSGRETYQHLVLPLSLNLRIPGSRPKLFYTIGAGVGGTYLLSSAFHDVKRVNRQIFSEEITMDKYKTSPFRRRLNVSAQLELGLEYKYLGYFWGARMGLSSMLFNFTQYQDQQQMYLNTMSTGFGWLDDDFVLAHGYFSVFIRKPIYKFLKPGRE